jgi:uncharacterized protein
MLINKSNKKVLARITKFADTPWKRAKGLMLTKDFKYALIFILPRASRLHASIHTMFMHIPIDVIFADSERKVLEIHHRVKPWKLHLTPKDHAKYVIEFPEGTLKGKVRKGNVLKW